MAKSAMNKIQFYRERNIKIKAALRTVTMLGMYEVGVKWGNFFF